jgi:hypothetical protein
MIVIFDSISWHDIEGHHNFLSKVPGSPQIKQSPRIMKNCNTMDPRFAGSNPAEDKIRSTPSFEGK